jgi:hypothetical protein
MSTTDPNAGTEMRPPFRPPEWKEGDGKTLYHYANKPLGHRCLWTARWTVPRYDDEDKVTGGYNVSVEGWMHATAIENMSDLQLRCELEDLCAWDWQFAGQAYRLAYGNMARNLWLYETEKLLRTVRPAYPEFTASWGDVPGRMHIQRTRPGW